MSEHTFGMGLEPIDEPSDNTMGMATRGAREGAADAREMAERTWAGAGLFLSRFVYTASYTISYGVVFPASLISRSIPRDNLAVRGLIEGARAATEKVHQVRGERGPASENRPTLAIA